MFNRSSRLKPFVVLFALLLGGYVSIPAAPVAAQENKTEPQASAAPTGLRVFTCGHSFHVWVVPILSEMAGSAGIKDHTVAGVSSIGGSRVIQHWNVPDEKNKAKAALIAGKVDVLTLSPIFLPDEGIEKFAKLAFEHNPEVRVTLQEFWLPNDEYVPVYPLQTKKKIDHNAATGAELRKQHEPYFRGMDDLIRELNKQLGKDVVYAVPVGQAVIALREKVIAGEAPGIKTQAELFRDSWGHPTGAIKALAGYCHFAVIYRKSPVGLPLPSAKSFPRTSNAGDDEKLNHLLQELAWDAVIHHPLSGVKAEK